MDYIYGNSNKRNSGDDEDKDGMKRSKTLGGLPAFLPNQFGLLPSTLPTAIPSALANPSTNGASLSSKLNYDHSPKPATSLQEQLSTISQNKEEQQPLASSGSEANNKSDTQSASEQTSTAPQQKQQPPNEKKEIVPIQGTSISLKTDKDIEEWIKQRKMNWMKKISNNRPIEEQGPPKDEENESNPNKSNHQNKGNNKKQANNNNNRNQRNNNSNSSNNTNSNDRSNNNSNNNNNTKRTPNAPKKKGVTTVGPNVNLNNLIIQRELMVENIEVLKFIKAIFKTGAYKPAVNDEELNDRNS